MRKIINSTYISLDGVVENPHLWPSTGPWDDTVGTIQTEMLLRCDAVLMGRHTYEGFAPVWPTRSGDPLSDHINTMAKYVVSSTLKDPEWANTTVISGDVVEEINRLKAADGADIMQYGIGPLTYTMLEHHLLDELHLWVHPLIVGNADHEDLMFRKSTAHFYTLADTKALPSGIVLLSYTANPVH